MTRLPSHVKMNTNFHDQEEGLATSLVGKAVRGVGWVALSSGLVRIFNFVSLAILARLISPADFGLVGIAFLIVNALAIFQGLGLGAALIYRKDGIQKATNTAFLLTALTGFLLSVLSFLLAPYVGFFFNLQGGEATLVIRVLFVKIFIDSLGLIQASLLEKELMFKRKTLAEASFGVAQGVVSIALALLGYGVWSLVHGQLVASALRTVVLWRVWPHPVSWGFDTTIAREILGYGKHMLGFNVINFALMNVDYFIVGRVLGATALGFYSIAFNVSNLPTTNLTHVVGRVMFPTYSKLQDDKTRLAKAFFTTLHFVSFLSLPVGIGILLLARPFVLAILGSKWMAAIPAMQALAIFGIMRSLMANVGELYKSVGRPDIIVKIHSGWLVVLAPILLLASRYDILGVGVAQSTVIALCLPVYFLFALRILGMGWQALISALSPGLRCSAVLFGTLLPFEILAFRVLPLSYLANLLLSVVVGVLVYLGAAFVLSRETLSEGRALLLSLRKGSEVMQPSEQIAL